MPAVLGPDPVQERRLRAFKARTVALGWIGGVVAGMAALVGAVMLHHGLDMVQRARAGGLPTVHIPDVVRTATGTSALVWVFGGIVMLALFGLSSGIFVRKNMLGMVVVVGLVGLADFAINTPTRQAMLAIPSELERHIRSGRYGEAEQILASLELPVAAAQYVKAQIALRANDAAALKKVSLPLLETVDDYAYGAMPSGDWASDPYADFDAGVIHAIDVAVNGRAVSGVGIEYERRRGSRPWSDGVQLALQASADLALAGLSVFLLRTWNAMRRRVVRLDAFLEQVRASDDPEPEEVQGLGKP